MVQKTHREEPWVDTNSDEFIQFSEIKRYYSENEDCILG